MPLPPTHQYAPLAPWYLFSGVGVHYLDLSPLRGLPHRPQHVSLHEAVQQGGGGLSQAISRDDLRVSVCK